MPNIRINTIAWVGLLTYRIARLDIGQTPFAVLYKCQYKHDGPPSCQTSRMTSFSGSEGCNREGFLKVILISLKSLSVKQLC